MRSRDGAAAGRRRVLRAALFGAAALAAPGASTAQVARPEVDEAVRLIVAQTNEFRSASGQAALTVDETLAATAATFARYMARTDRYSHEADGRTPSARAVAQGYDYCVVLENIAFMQSSVGFQTAELARRLVTGWKESPGHRKNMLDPDVTQTGVAIAQSDRTERYYAVQMFGRPKSAAITFSIANDSPANVRYRLGSTAYDLGPGVTRTHQQCRVESLVLPAASAGGGERADLQPAGGENYVVRGDNGGLRVERR